MLLLDLDAHARTPLYQQVTSQIMRLVDDGTLQPGAQLPASRRLAVTLGVNRTTVYRAYQELWARGYLESRPGSYSTVRRPGQAPGRTAAAEATPVQWDDLVAPTTRQLFQDFERLPSRAAASRATVNFATLAADRDLCPAGELRRAVKHALLTQGKDLLGYGDPQGLGSLRETIAQRLRTHGVFVSPGEVLVTGGSQQALDLVLRTLTAPGDRIVTEAPTYSMAHPLFRLHRLAVTEVPMRADGLDLDALDAALGHDRAALVYTIPNFQNPTGITTSQAHRERLLALCRAHRVPLVEDGFEEEMKYFGKAVLPVKSMDRDGLVVYLGTFSKVVFSGLRVGWVAAAPDCIRRLLAVHRFANLSGNTLGQAALARFIAAGYYEAHLRRLHRVYRARMQAMLRGLATHLPPGVEWTRPAGGYTLWVQIPGLDLDEPALLGHLQQAGLEVAPGSTFFASPPAEPCFRLSIANLKEPEIAEGCRRLGRALAALLEGRHAA